MSTERSPKLVKKYGAFEMQRGTSMQTLAAAIAEVAQSLGGDARIDDIKAVWTNDAVRFELVCEIREFE